MLKITLKLDNIVYTEMMYEKEFELFKLTNEHVEILNVEKFDAEKDV